MLNIEESTFALSFYSKPKDVLITGICVSGTVAFFVDILRQQVPETKLLQLIPGFYIILLFSSFSFLYIYSEIIFKRTNDIDDRRELGSKTVNRLQIPIVAKTSFNFLLSFLFVSLWTLVPISLDSFRAFEEVSLENLWSLEEIIKIDNILITFIVNIAQVPTLAVCYVTTDRLIILASDMWRVVSFIAIVISGVATPTVDGGTQLIFAVAILIIYISTLAYVSRRYLLKYPGSLSFNF
jgi:hypothetical protein